MRSVQSYLPTPAAWIGKLVQPVVRRLQRAYEAAAEGRDLPAFSLTLDDGSVHRFGTGDTACRLRVRNRDGMAALASLDESRVGLAYMAGDIDFEGDMLALLRLRPLVSDRHPLRELWFKLLHPLVFGQTRSDAKWIAQHYDEDADFYLLFLDRRRIYSHGLFEDDDESLDAAILRKLDFALEAVGIGPGQRLLDIGAGWGGMLEHAGGRGIDVTSLTISEASESFCRRLIADQGLPCRVVKEHFLDYRSDEPYDAIVNLGVTEHLPDYKSSLAQYWRLLKPGGKLYLDACASRTKFPFHSFTYQYVFPGNATPLCLHDYLAEVEKTRFEILAVYNDRHSYELTTRRWAENLERSREVIVARFGQSWFRRFQLYLWGCVDVFSRDDIGAFRVILRKPKTA